MAGMTTTDLLKAAAKKQKGVVVLPVEEYNRLIAAQIPTYYLKGKAADRLDRLVEKSLKEYREGKTRHIKSLADLD
jgi:hypothetical protein